MLRNLVIRNYALIDRIELEFCPGLTIITGETGAGKSIMLGALSLVMGGRADTKVISDGDSKSVVEAVFTDVDPELATIFEEKGIEWSIDDKGVSELTVRREISASGRSKVYINDTSVTLQTLSAIMPRLIDIHSQHANVKINDPLERLAIIDSMSGNAELRQEYRLQFERYVELRKTIKKLRENKARIAENADFVRFRLEQLDRLNPRKGELEDVERRYELLSDADETKDILMSLSSILGDSDNGVLTFLANASGLASKIDVELETEIKDLLNGAKDICSRVDDLYANIDSDPGELLRLSTRMNDYYDALKRFKVSDADGLVALHKQLKSELAALDGDESRLPEIESEARAVAADLRLKAEAISNSRRLGAEAFSKLLCDKARPLGLPNIKFEAVLSTTKLTSTGQDEVEFLCSFNRDGVLRPVSDIASGGEISRMMLSLKAIMAGHVNLPTIIFDEVDTGVSGEIADKMGRMMHDMSKKMQVIVITHLPQVAAKGDDHFKVFKTDADQKTYTRVERLDSEGRIRELAAMISGSAVTDAALSAARELISESKTIQ